MLSQDTVSSPAAHTAADEASAPRPPQTLAERRAALFRESWNGWAQRWILGAAYALKPDRIHDTPHLVYRAALDLVRGGTHIPERGRTWSRPDTFGGVCRAISPETVLAAARAGFFPWCHCGPLKWWTREKRMVLFFNEYHIAKRLRRDMKKAPYRVTFDQAFEEVIAACAGHRSYNRHSLTWITPKIMALYTELFDQGHAHSFEVWDADGKLVGGGYGLAAGPVFMTESQFSLAPNTSKMGFAVLNYHLAKWGFLANDGKDFTPTIDAMGFRAIPRAEFDALLDNRDAEAKMTAKTGRWNVETDMATVAAWQPAPAKEAVAA